MIDCFLAIVGINWFLKDLMIHDPSLNLPFLESMLDRSTQPLSSDAAIADRNLEMSTSKNIKVFILAGQSNMVGSLSNMEDLPSEMTVTQNNTLWYDRQNRWVPLKPPTEPLPSTGRMAYQVGFGPEISVGVSISTVIGETVALIKYSKNGTNLEIDWNPNYPNSLYHKMLVLVNEAIGDLSQLGYTPEISGFFWMQGESDAKSDFYMANNYALNLSNFIQTLRKDLNQPNLPFVYGLIPLTNQHQTSFGDFIYADQVRENQKLVAKNLSYTQTLSTLSLSKAEDNLHFDSQGYINLGKNFAAKWLEMDGSLQNYLREPADRYQWTKINTFPPIFTPNLAIYGRQCLSSLN
ncbi:sialate O-acetylesterase [Oxynema aestuarii]|uniref:Sialate O-acetylesterase n=1 Tax=Oxynema aestuarii AP17 TaxID=2064643 RepID=A0A6H1U2T4_9CYAN|nr:sialate O-acetylesterase [Oxynema aestuarii]QIZ72965.1 sialate O-acetylesterase [Oxynema aestuarii AP17]